MKATKEVALKDLNSPYPFNNTRWGGARNRFQEGTLQWYNIMR